MKIVNKKYATYRVWCIEWKTKNRVHRLGVISRFKILYFFGKGYDEKNDDMVLCRFLWFGYNSKDQEDA